MPNECAGAQPIDPQRRALLSAGAGLLLGAASGCAVTRGAAFEWEARLTGPARVLLGEVHDNPEHHRLRAAALGRAIEAGWQPTIVMEQFDLDRQADIDRARRERPDDAQHVIDQAGAGGWPWRDYRVFVDLALRHRLPLLAGNLSRATANRLAREDYASVLGAERVASWQLQPPPDGVWQAAQEREIDLGHCGMLPQRLWSGLARGQFARDAAMAHLLARHASRGVVLLAGNGHVRRDLGVPRWLLRQGAPAALVVGFVERGSPGEVDGRYDAVVVTAPARRPDPCEGMRQMQPRAAAVRARSTIDRG